jgi:Skp family chaperone for outer membrane proteins
MRPLMEAAVQDEVRDVRVLLFMLRPRECGPISALLAALLLGACSDAPRVGVVDVQAAYQHSPLLLVSAHEIKKELGNTEREIKQRGRELAELRQLLAHGDVGTDRQRLALVKRVEQESASLVELETGYRLRLEAARKRAGERMIARVEEVARQVAEERGLDFLVRRSDLLYERADADFAGVDMTADVARALLAKINPTEIPQPPEAEPGS